MKARIISSVVLFVYIFVDSEVLYIYFVFAVTEEEKMQEALKKSIKNRRGSVNVVPFESALLYGQPKKESEDLNTNNVETGKRAVSKLRR